VFDRVYGNDDNSPQQTIGLNPARSWACTPLAFPPAIDPAPV